MNETPRVAATNFALDYFARRIGREMIDTFLFQPSLDPGSQPPSPAEIQNLQQSNLIFINGVNHSPWIQHISLPQERLINTSESFSDNYIELNSFIHRHGPQGNRSSRQVAIETWLDLAQAKRQAETILSALIDMLPDKEKELRSNYLELAADLEKTDLQLKQVCQNLKGLKFFAATPVYHYFARRYELEIYFLSDELNIKNNENEIDSAKFKALLDQFPATWVIWPGEPPKIIAQRLLDEFDIHSISIDPGVHSPSKDSDWLELIRQAIQQLQSITHQ